MIDSSGSRAATLATAVGNGVHVIDTLYVRPGHAASHLIVESGRAAFVDTGTAFSVPRLLGALEELGMGAEQVDYVFLTHPGSSWRLCRRRARSCIRVVRPT